MPPGTDVTSFASTLLVAASLLAPATSQCTPQWQPGDPIAAPSGAVDAMTTWDPDGAGPMPLSLVIAGEFDVGQSIGAQVAIYDGTAWTTLPQPFLEVTATAVWNGQLVVAGRNPSGYVAVRLWSGSVWQSIGGLSAAHPAVPEVRAITTFQGDLYVAGRFSGINGTSAANVARWNGTTWSSLGSGTGGPVHALASHTWQNNPGLYVGGEFATAGGVTASALAVWNGNAWSPVAGINGPVRALASRITASANTSYLFVGGSFSTVGTLPVANVARYQPSTNSWLALGNDLSGCHGLVVRGTGLSSYELTARYGSALRQWNGVSWSTLGGQHYISPSCHVWYGGRHVIGKSSSEGCRAWDGVAWQRLYGAGIAGFVSTVDANGPDLVIGGNFRSISGVAVDGVARGGPGAWTAVGGGLLGATGVVWRVLRLGNGDIVAAGSFSAATGGAGENIARWDGSTWQPLGTGLSGTAYAVAELANGDIVVAGAFTFAGGATVNNIARWNGSYWADLDGGVQGVVNDMAVRADGTIVVAGSLTAAGSGAVPTNRIALWNGSSWSAVAPGIASGQVGAVAFGPAGELYVGGSFTPVGGGQTYLARWSAAGGFLPHPSTAQQPQSVVDLVLPLPNGDLVVGGSNLAVPTANGVANDRLVRLRGGVWQPLSVDDSVWEARSAPNGDVVVCGSLESVGPFVASGVARLAVTCPATATSTGQGCTGSNGANVLTATSLPWLGSVCRARATGLPTFGFALSVHGFAPTSIPIAAVLPQGLPGCTLLASPDLLVASLSNAGVTETAVGLPNTLALAGQTLWHQVLALELGAALQITAVTGTNALALTIGSL